MVSVVLISFDGTTEQNLETARELGFRHVQLRNVGTDLTVEELTPLRRELLSARLSSVGLAVSSLSGGYGPLLETNKTEERVEGERRLTRLAYDLGCRYVTGHIGSVRESEWRHNSVFLRTVGTWIEEMEAAGTVFAVESGPEHGESLRKLIDYFDSPSFRVNLDPANFLFYGYDVLSSCEALYDVSVHFHCKDARRRTPEDQLHASSVAGFPDAVHAEEVCVGKGEIPFDTILPELMSRRTVAVAAVERESGETRQADVLVAKRVLEQYFGANQRERSNG